LNSEDNDKQKQKLAKPTPTPSLASDSPSAIPTVIRKVAGVRPVFEEPVIPTVGNFSLISKEPIAVPISAPATSLAPAMATVAAPSAAPVVATNPTSSASNRASVVQKSPPTVAPSITVVAASEPILYTDTVKANPLYLRVVGEFDPLDEEGDFFAVVEEMFGPYSKAYISYILKDFDIAVVFLNALTQMTAVAGGSTLATSWCEVNVTFHIASETEQYVADFTVERASQFVKRFFMESHKVRLINRMAETGVPVEDLEALDTLPDDMKAILEPASKPEANPVPPMEKHADGDRSSLAVTIASGGVIFLAIGALVFASRPRNRVSDMHGRSSLISGGEDPTTAKALAFVSGEHLGGVKPAALHVRNRRERWRQRAMSSNNTVATYFTTESAFTTVSHTEEQRRDNVDANEVVTSAPTGSRLVDLAVSSALTCLDGDESVGALNEAYPEFELYQSNASPPPSPVWSIDNYSNSSPYSVEEDYAAERRRWHDQANELDLIALPDTSSVYSMTQYSQSDRSEMEESSTRTRRDAV
jgi:hypothetical protein